LREFINDPRLLVTPHVGWYSREAANDLRQMAITNALDILESADATEGKTHS
jgi:phosphoglycerate dehydrogenase-like enzyme